MTAIRAAAFVATAALTAFGLACDRPLEIPPTPTPVSLAGLAVVELAADVWLTDVFGDQGVGTGQDGELYLVNVKTGETRQLTNDGHWKGWAVLSADYVAWTDERRQIVLPGDIVPASIADDIFVLDLNTGEQRSITDEPAERYALQGGRTANSSSI